jgi:hypothetical protein
MYADDPDGFLTKYQKAEAEYNADKRHARTLLKSMTPTSSAAADPGTEKCLELVDRLLAEHGTSPPANSG